jgi:WD40 repeat protein
MTLSAGTRLGPYEILGSIGAGGMGEVYRARDPRLGREVAVKVLPASFSDDADRLRRFEQEARAAGVLNHPNIIAVYDIGTNASDGSPYVVQELLEGETLRAELAGGRLSPRRATEYAIQIARGLAAAHEKGIVHRDLKPENLFVTKDGRVKILDFGLAKLTQMQAGPGLQTNLPTANAATEPGVVMGTLGYMSPEQVRGKPADPRSDIFSFGAILYEMLSGKRAFLAGSAGETMAAILKEDPPDLSATSRGISPGLERIVRHCLEKSPERRFHSAHDVAFALEALSGSGPTPAPEAPPVRRRGPWRIPTLVVLLAVVATALYLAGRRSVSSPVLSFEQLTFRRGNVRRARFAPDGSAVIYAAAWDGQPAATYSSRPGNPESSALVFPGGSILALASTGQIALMSGRLSTEPYVISGTFVEGPLTGAEAPRERLHGVQWVDWSPDGSRIAVVRDEGGRNRLESPIGNVLYESSGWIGSPRFSPTGDAIALLDHWARIGDMGSVVLVELSGKTRTLSEGWNGIQGLAWRPDGKEIWFTGAKVGGNRSIYATDRSGRLRPVFRQAGSLRLEDISRAGEALLVNDEIRVGIVCRPPGASRDRDLSWLNFAALRDYTPDGKKILFDESGEAGGDEGTIYLRDTDGSPPVRLGNGFGTGLSPDGRWAIASGSIRPNSLRLLPAGAGEPRPVAEEPFPITWASWLPDGKAILVSGGTGGQGTRLYLQALDGSPPRPLTGEGVHLIPYSNLISPDGRWVAAIGADRAVALLPLDGGKPRPVAGLEAEEIPCGWDSAGKALFVYRPGDFPARVTRLDIETGSRKPLIELMPGDPTGVTFIRPPHFTGDGASYAYSFSRRLSELYLVKGLK